jgi:hypothetical protein
MSRCHEILIYEINLIGTALEQCFSAGGTRPTGWTGVMKIGTMIFKILPLNMVLNLNG